MAGAPRRSVALLLACAVGLGGCSLVMTHPPPDRYTDPARPIAPIESCASASAPVADVLVAVLVSALMIKSASEEKLTGGAALFGLAIVGVSTGSAVYGFSARSRCARVGELNARCMKGDQAACLSLSPGYRPGTPPEVPLLCGGDAACGPGRRCVESACVPVAP